MVSIVCSSLMVGQSLTWVGSTHGSGRVGSNYVGLWSGQLKVTHVQLCKVVVSGLVVSVGLVTFRSRVRILLQTICKQP